MYWIFSSSEVNRVWMILHFMVHPSVDRDVRMVGDGHLRSTESGCLDGRCELSLTSWVWKYLDDMGQGNFCTWNLEPYSYTHNYIPFRPTIGGATTHSSLSPPQLLHPHVFRICNAPIWTTFFHFLHFPTGFV